MMTMKRDFFNNVKHRPPHDFNSEGALRGSGHPLKLRSDTVCTCRSMCVCFLLQMSFMLLND